MGRYQEWKAAAEQGRAERILARAKADEAEEAAHARDRALELARLQRVPASLELELHHTDWLELIGPSITVRLHLVLSTIHEPIMYQGDVGWVRVWGHAVRCGRQPDHAPCITLMARVAAILDAVPS